MALRRRMRSTLSTSKPVLLADVERAVDRVVDRARARIRLELDLELVRLVESFASARSGCVLSAEGLAGSRARLRRSSSAPVNPSCAMRAAVTPLRAAGPGLKRFCIEGPYISISPRLRARQAERRRRAFRRSSRSSLPAATVAPNTPHVGVVWKPRLRSDGLVALLARSIISQPAASAVSSSLPSRPRLSAAASAAE